MTSIYLAARKSEYAVVKYLCSIDGIIEHMENSPENNAFHFAINNNHIKLVRIFLFYKASSFYLEYFKNLNASYI